MRLTVTYCKSSYKYRVLRRKSFTWNVATKRRNRRKPFCSKCGDLLEKTRVGRYSYCKKCHAEYMRLYRPKHRDLSPEAKMKANVRSITKYYVKVGRITKGTCIKCGSFDTQAHHNDYAKPLEVEWMCRRCHLLEHGHKPKK